MGLQKEHPQSSPLQSRAGRGGFDGSLQDADMPWYYRRPRYSLGSSIVGVALIVGGVLFVGGIIAAWPAKVEPPYRTPSRAPEVVKAAAPVEVEAPEVQSTPTTTHEFASPVATNAPEAPPAPPDDPAPIMSEAKRQRANGFVLWKGEWVTPDERQRLRNEEDAAKVAASRRPAPPPPDDEPVVNPIAEDAPVGQFRQFDPSRINPAGLSSRGPDTIGPRGGISHISKNGNKVYSKKR